METIPAFAAAHAARLVVETTKGTEFIDLTDRIQALVSTAALSTGLVAIQTTHTTTGVIVNEHEPQLIGDFIGLLDRLAPRGTTYAHDDMTRRMGVPPDEPANGHAHCRALLLPTSTVVNVCSGRLTLGRWQRIFLAELDGPRRREVTVVAYGETRL
jgi:secondary thiamine-phosphate synthase enzyme